MYAYTRAVQRTWRTSPRFGLASPREHRCVQLPRRADALGADDDADWVGLDLLRGEKRVVSLCFQVASI